MAITPLPSPPAPTDSTAQFNSKAFAWVAAIDTFTTEANALQVDVNAKEASVTVGAAAVAAQSPVANAAAAANSAALANQYLGQTEYARDQALAGLGAADNSQILSELIGQDAYATDLAAQAVKEVAGVPTGVDLIGNFLGSALDLAGVAARQSASNLQLVPAPANATARGNPGEWAVDSGYIYICTAVNTWKRVAIATWP